MSIQGKAEIRVGVKLTATKKQMEEELKKISSGLTVNVKSIQKGIEKEGQNIKKAMQKALTPDMTPIQKRINEQFKLSGKSITESGKFFVKELNKLDKDIERIGAKREQSEIDRRKRETQLNTNQVKAMNAEYIRASKERQKVLTEEAKIRMALSKATKPVSQVQNTKTIDAINNMFVLSKAKAKESASVWVREFDRIGTEIKKTKTIDAINNMYAVSKKNAKQSADVWKQSFKEIEQAVKVSASKNKQFTQWFMPQQSKNLPTASTSAFNLTQGEMGDKNKAFNQWFIPKSTTDNINSAKASMSAFNTELSRGAKIYDRHGKVNKEATANFRNMNRELINATGNQFKFSTMLGQGIKKMLIWSNMVIMEFNFKLNIIMLRI